MKANTCFGYSVSLLSLLAIIACSEVSEAQSSASPDAEKVRLKTRAAFVDAVTDKTLVYVNEAGQMDERIKFGSTRVDTSTVSVSSMTTCRETGTGRATCGVERSRARHMLPLKNVRFFICKVTFCL